MRITVTKPIAIYMITWPAGKVEYQAFTPELYEQFSKTESFKTLLSIQKTKDLLLDIEINTNLKS